MKTYYILTLFFLFSVRISSQSIVKGELINIDDQKVVNASVKLINPYSKALIHSTFSDSQGLFQFDNISIGDYILLIEHLHIQSFNKNIQVQKDIIDLGVLKMEDNVLEEVIITSRKSKFEYKVDRKVIRPVGTDLAITAVDLLRGVPSFEIDITGKIKYRGGGSFIVHINGRPVKNGTEKLLQISSEQIERIEIISNPSSEYGAEGILGIISVILKKNMLDDFSLKSSITGTSIGDLNSYLSITKKFQGFSIGATFSGGNYLWYQSTDKKNQIITIGDSIIQAESKLNNKNSQTHFNTEINSEITLSQKSKLEISFNITPLNKYNYDKNYGEFANKITTNNIVNTDNYILESLKKSVQNSIGSTINYQFRINDSTELTSYLDYSTNITPFREEKFDRKLGMNGQLSNSGYYLNQKSSQINAQIKYDLKLQNEESLNFGAHYKAIKTLDFNLENNFFGFENDYNIFDQKFNFERKIYSGFINYSFAINKLSIQLGSRIESSRTLLNFSSNIVNEKIKNTQFNYFPSLYFLYNFKNDDQLGLNYSKRINRPDEQEMAPMIKYEDLYSTYHGNPNINFYNSHSFELNYKKQFNQSNVLSLEAYHRIHNNPTEELSAVDNINNVLIVQPDNIGNSYVSGAGFYFTSEISSFWNIDLAASANYKKLFYDKESIVRKQISYTFNINNNFQLENDWSILYSLNYYGPILNAQNKRNGHFLSWASLTKSFNEKRWTIGLSAYNIFNSVKYKFNSYGNNFSYDYLIISKPSFLLKISYNFKK